MPKQGRFRSKSYKSVQEVAAGRRKKNREKTIKNTLHLDKNCGFCVAVCEKSPTFAKERGTTFTSTKLNLYNYRKKEYEKEENTLSQMW